MVYICIFPCYCVRQNILKNSNTMSLDRNCYVCITSIYGFMMRDNNLPPFFLYTINCTNYMFTYVKILTRIFRPEYMDMEEETGGLFWQAKARYRYTGMRQPFRFAILYFDACMIALMCTYSARDVCCILITKCSCICMHIHL
jgi:hypothetical protein